LRLQRLIVESRKIVTAQPQCIEHLHLIRQRKLSEVTAIKLELVDIRQVVVRKALKRIAGEGKFLQQWVTMPAEVMERIALKSEHLEFLAKFSIFKAAQSDTIQVQLCEARQVALNQLLRQFRKISFNQ